MPANMENSAVATGLKKSVFIPIPKKCNEKNVQTTAQLHSFHTLVRLCSKSFKLGFRSMWTENFQMYKLGLEKAEDQRSNCQQSLDHTESKGFPEKHLLLLHWLCKSLWLCESQETGKFLQKQEYNHLTCLLRNLYAGQETAVRTWHGIMDWFQIGEGVQQGCISLCLCNLYAEYIMRNVRLGEITS